MLDLSTHPTPAPVANPDTAPTAAPIFSPQLRPSAPSLAPSLESAVTTTAESQILSTSNIVIMLCVFSVCLAIGCFFGRHRIKSCVVKIPICQADTFYDNPGNNDTAETQAESFSDDPSMWAITYNQLLEVRDLAATMADFESMTMRDINEKIITPSCLENEKSYALSNNNEGLKIEVFVSHAWDEPFAEFVQSIEEAYRNKMTKPNLWICAFALMQGSADKITTQLGSDEIPLDQSPFVRALREAEGYLIVRNSNQDLCARVWCICEFMYAKEYGFIPHKTHVTGPGTFSKSETSCLEASSYSRKDKAKIMTHLLKKHSFEEIDDFMIEVRAFAIAFC